LKILIIYHSVFGNTKMLAESISAGAKSAGAEVTLQPVAEADPRELINYDAIILGCPTRFGTISAELKAFMDRTGYVWKKGELVGKVGAGFITSNTVHGGHETTLLSIHYFLFNHGMIVVGVPPTVRESDYAGSYYGASARTVDGKTPPTEDDKKVAFELGKRVAEIAGKISSA
jgi:NAD(P)H dehydrogenase (quinone)